MGPLLAGFLALLALVLFIEYVRYKYSYWKRMGVTSTPPTFLVGHYFRCLFKNENLTLMFDELYQKFKDSDRVVGIYQCLTPQVLIIDHTLVKEITVKNFGNFMDTSFAHVINPSADPLLERNPFFSAGADWKAKRAELLQAFTTGRIKAMFPLMEQVCVDMIQYLDKKQDFSMEARDLSSRYTCDVVSSCGFGASAESFLHEQPHMRDQAQNVFSTGFRMQYRWMMSLLLPFINKRMPSKLVPKDVQQFFIDLMATVVENRHKTGPGRRDHLDHLLAMAGKRPTSDLELAANAITFFLDGLETSSVAIAGAIYQLAENKDIQSRLRHELEGVETLEQLVDHEYLDLVWAEALRMHTPSGWADRMCTEDIELDVLEKEKKLKFRKGDMVFIPIRPIHFDPHIYEEPERFNPERFAHGALKKYRDDGVFLAFGSGPRMCTGLRFANAQAKACLAAAVRNFEIDVAEPTRPPRDYLQDFMTYYEKELWVKFKRIESCLK